MQRNVWLCAAGALVLVIAIGSTAGEDGKDCVNSGGPDCWSSMYLGSVCGDEFDPSITVTGCGGGWYSFEIRDCAIGLGDLSFVAILTTPADGADYDMQILRDCDSVVGSVTGSDQRRMRIYEEWDDTWGSDDTRIFNVEIDLVSGTPIDEWSLEINGDASPLSDVPETPPAQVLLQNTPNPFNPATTIGFSLAAATEVSLDVFSIDGRHVVTLLEESMTKGAHKVLWNARDCHGRRIPSGTYFYRLQAGDYVETKRMTLLK